MKNIKYILLGLLLLHSVLLSGCEKNTVFPADRVPENSKLTPISVKNINSTWNNTARFIAGLPVEGNSLLQKASTGAEYKKYSRMIEKSWNGFITGNMGKIKKWRESSLKKTYSTSVFYPFSGPDILNALVFYPEARDILMFGLEPTGGIPGAESTGTENILKKLKAVAPALNFTLNHAFFVTTDMQEKVGKNEFSGITGLMMFFLARGGYEIIQVKKIFLDRNGNLSLNAPAVKNKKSVKGVEIIFTGEKRGKLRRVRYFQIDIGDTSLQFESFRKFTDRYNNFSTIIKSASYLMQWNTFSKIRNLILNRSETILQDDSGVPFRYFKSNTWNITGFGKYHKPLPVFKTHYQKDLKRFLEKNAKSMLPFSYGYGYGYPDMTYHLILAEKKKGENRK